ncbi:YraN family protein [Corynebacterium uberis]|uniref:YraN family protein n=1 Tax=Corynebacterium uberis TaxID=2883169 RepID=UPI001D0B33ED|nr:YraN family protein [Corynebacterium uberis]UDL81666.1 YraN family protein [Corynebacterium uberis]
MSTSAPPSAGHRRQLGRQGEAFAAAYYRDRGAHILAMNVAYPCGELDLICQEDDGTVVFVEVKTRSTPDFGTAEAITARKLGRMRRAAVQWLRGTAYVPVRFDVLALTVVGRHQGLGGEEHLLFDTDWYPGVDDAAN